MPWNEIEFLPWERFRRMAPSITQLEIARLEGLIEAAGSDLELRNDLVKVRYELISFLAELERCEEGVVSDGASAHLDAAILSLPLGRAEGHDEMHADLTYILERLRSVHKRIDLIYR